MVEGCGTVIEVSVVHRTKPRARVLLCLARVDMKWLWLSSTSVNVHAALTRCLGKCRNYMRAAFKAMGVGGRDREAVDIDQIVAAGQSTIL